MSHSTTIVMAAYNAEQYIDAAIESIVAQTRSDWELVITNDGSTDATADIVERWTQKDSRIKMLVQENGGCAAARNNSIANTSSEFVVIFDADDLMAPTYLERLIGALEAHPTAAIACCDAYEFNQPGVILERCAADGGMAPPHTAARVIARETQIYGEVAIRREWFDRLGSFDASLRYCEDFDMWTRVLLAGGEIVYVDEPLAWYRVGNETSNSRQSIAMRNSEIAVFQKIREHHPEHTDVCDRRIQIAEHARSVDLAKAALKDEKFDEFFQHASDAQTTGSNPKLMMAAMLARVAPSLTRQLVRDRL